MKYILSFLFVCQLTFAEARYVASDKFFRALAAVESGGSQYPNETLDGRLGPYRISYEYWKEAMSHDDQIGGTFDDCRAEMYSRKVVNAYLNKHVPSAVENKTYEILAKTHKFGPFWKSQPFESDEYWNNFKKHLTSYWF